STPCVTPVSGARVPLEDPVVVGPGVAPSVGVVRQYPQLALGCGDDVPQPAVLAHEVLGGRAQVGQGNPPQAFAAQVGDVDRSVRDRDPARAGLGRLPLLDGVHVVLVVTDALDV